uniref:Secreted antigen n=1 Tax=Sipha flava TaxID=143950 RepID=A0A2S2R0J0_9HEMI
MWHVALCLICVALCTFSTELPVDLAMWKANIIPNIIPFAPLARLRARFPSGKKVNNGNYISAHDAQGVPDVTWDGSSSSFYTLALINAGEFQQENDGILPFRKWFVINIPGDDVSKGTIINPFVESTTDEYTVTLVIVLDFQ